MDLGLKLSRRVLEKYVELTEVQVVKELRRGWGNRQRRGSLSWQGEGSSSKELKTTEECQASTLKKHTDL